MACSATPASGAPAGVVSRPRNVTARPLRTRMRAGTSSRGGTPVALLPALSVTVTRTSALLAFPLGSRAVSRPLARVVGSAVAPTEICPPLTPEAVSATSTISVRPDGGRSRLSVGVPSTLTVCVEVAGLPAASLTVTLTVCAPSASPLSGSRAAEMFAQGAGRV